MYNHLKVGTIQVECFLFLFGEKQNPARAQKKKMKMPKLSVTTETQALREFVSEY